MPTEDSDRFTITFPGLSPADAVMMAHELERELLDAGVPAEAIRSARADAEAMDLGGILVILAGVGGFELLKEAVKGAASEAGHQAFKALSAQVRQAINRVCQRRRVGAEVTILGEPSRVFGEEFFGNKPEIAALADIGTLGVVILGASKYPHLDGYDNPAFARSAAMAETLFGRKTPVFKQTAVLNLFDKPEAPADIIKAIGRHIGAISDMRDLLIYYCGHGGFLRDRTYFLTLTGTDKEQLASTGLKLRELRHDLESKLLDRRLYVVLDCCYAGEAVKEFMGPDIDRAVEGGLMEALPPNGWTVLTAAAPESVAIAPAGHELTMFTGALAHVLNGDEARVGRTLSFADIAYEAKRFIQRTHGLKAVRPQCHTPRQDAGDLARVPLFGHPAAAPPRDEGISGGKPGDAEPAATTFSPVTSERGELIRMAAQEWPAVRDSRNLQKLTRFERHFAGTWHAEEARELRETIEAEAAGQREAAAKRQVEEQNQRAEAERLRAEGRVAVQVGDPAAATTRWLKPGGGEPFCDLVGGPEMVVVPAGSFLMGSPEDEPQRFADESPRHTVSIARPFAVGQCAVTRGQYATFVKATGRKDSWWKREFLGSWQGLGFRQDDDHPVVCVDWDDATAYVRWLTESTGKPYRLLTEAEWEYAARAGSKTPYWWGRSITPAQANYDGRGEYHKGTVPVGSFAANPWGLYNVHGNVWEWCEDVWHDTYEGAPADGTAWITGDSSCHVVRGGSWYNGPWLLRTAFRHWYTARINRLGFRVGRTLSP